MDDCVFCNRNQFEERLIAEVSGFYIIASLGQITDGGYVLLFPARHTPCLADISSQENFTMIMVAQQVCGALTAEYGLKLSPYERAYPITVFEHGIVGQSVKHGHLHFLPAAVDLTGKVRSDFPKSEIQELQYATHLQELYANRQEPYLFWDSGTEADNKPMVCWNPPAPAQYLRMIAARALGKPERADWHKMDTELDRKLWTETVRRLKSYF